jgi:hypothetical protein
MEIKATTGRVSLTMAHILGLLNTSSISPSALARFGQSIMFRQPMYVLALPLCSAFMVHLTGFVVAGYTK